MSVNLNALGANAPTTKGSALDEAIRTVLAEHGRLAVNVQSLAPTDDLYGAGLTSHASINVMLALEDDLDIEFPDALLKKSTFASIRAISDAIRSLQGEVVGG